MRNTFFYALSIAVVIGLVVWGSWDEGVISVAFVPAALTIPASAIVVFAWYVCRPKPAWQRWVILGLVALANWGAVLMPWLLGFPSTPSDNILIPLLALSWLSLLIAGLAQASHLGGEAMLVDTEPMQWDFTGAEVHPLAEQSYYDLDREAARMRRLSFLSLLGVGAIIILAVFVVLFAGLITNIDLRSTNALAVATTNAESTEQEYESTFRAREDASNALAKAVLSLESLNADDPTRGVAQTRLEDFRTELAKAEFAFVNAKQRNEEARIFLAKIRGQSQGVEGDATSEEASSTQALIASAVTRFGVITILLFFAQALINLYRYALTLSASLRSRALAIVLSKSSLSNLKEISDVLSHDHLSLGRAPQNPIGDAKKLAEIAKDLRGSGAT